MRYSRWVLLAGLGAGTTFGTSPAQREGHVRADRGDGTYRNPVLAGHWHDPTVLRVDEDYFLSHCEHDQRGPLIWHSRDLVNWRPLARVESLANIGTIWATDLILHEGKYYLYCPIVTGVNEAGGHEFSTHVVTADHPAGPWSDPVDLGIGGIDPGHVVDRDGRRFLYVNAGRVVELSPDGLSARGELKEGYGGWSIPADWVVECECLESPKLFWRDGWCYLVSALGGTAGPSTSHMVVVARARSALGPWENDPTSPLLRTTDRREAWWSQGHGTIIEASDGSWWMLYHALAHGRRSLGRNTLLVPIVWTDTGWPRLPPDFDPDGVMTKPPGSSVGHGLALSDDFTGSRLGLAWDYAHPTPDATARYQVGGGRLVMQAEGSNPPDAAQLRVLPANSSYEVQVRVESTPGVEAGLVLMGHGHTGLALRDGRVFHHRRNRPEAPEDFTGRPVWLRLRNRDHDLELFYSGDGEHWTKFHWGAAVSSEAVTRIVLYAAGEGQAEFRDFRYQGLPDAFRP